MLFVIKIVSTKNCVSKQGAFVIEAPFFSLFKRIELYGSVCFIGKKKKFQVAALIAAFARLAIAFDIEISVWREKSG